MTSPMPTFSNPEVAHPVSLTQYAERIKGSYPVLGTLHWYSLSDATISRSDLEALFQKVGLDEKYLPPRLRGVDAFRKATKKSERKAKDSGVTENYLIREVACESSEVERHIMRERVDSAGRRLSYDRVGVAVFHRPDSALPNGRVVCKNEAPYYDERLKDIVDAIIVDVHASFADHTNYLQGNALRGVVGRIMTATSTTSLRPSGGVYFSPKQYDDEIKKLGLFLDGLGNSVFHSLPLIDDRDQRQMLVSAFEREAVVEIERKMDDIRDLLTSGQKVTPGKANEYAQEFQRLKEKAKEYSELLDEQLERTGDTLTLFHKQIAQLLDKVE